MRGIRLKRLLCALVCITYIFALSGCADGSDVYDHFSKYQIEDRDLKLMSEGKMTLDYDRGDFNSIWEYLSYLAACFFSAGSSLIKQYSVYIIVGSFCLGLAMFLLARKSIQIRRIAVLLFMIGIPTLAFLAVYGSAILADLF